MATRKKSKYLLRLLLLILIPVSLPSLLLSQKNHPAPGMREQVLVRGQHLLESWIQVGIWDDKGNPVTDLDFSDFEIGTGRKLCVDSRSVLDRLAAGDSGVTREELEQIAESECDVSFFRNSSTDEETPRAIAVVVDISGSVASRKPDGSLPEKRVAELAEHVRNGLEEIFEPQDLYLFVRFSSVFYALGPTRDLEEFRRVLLRPYRKQWGDATPYYSIVRVVADRMAFARQYPRAIVMFSDCVPLDDIQAQLEMVAREMDRTLSLHDQASLARLQEELLVKKRERMQGALESSLQSGIPVYNIHFPDEVFQLSLSLKQECHRWIRRTGGRFFFHNGKEEGLKKILRQIDADIDNPYILAIRHDGLHRKKPRISIRNHPDWKVVYSEEYLSMGTMREVLTYKMSRGDPEERMEAAFVARDYQDGAIKSVLRDRVVSEVYDSIQEVVADSLFSLASENLCSDDSGNQEEALADIDRVFPFLDSPDEWRTVTRELMACGGSRETPEYLTSWFQRTEAPEAKPVLYSANLDWIRLDLAEGRVANALRHAGKLGGSDVEKILRDSLEWDHLKNSDRKKIRKFLSGTLPSDAPDPLPG